MRIIKRALWAAPAFAGIVGCAGRLAPFVASSDGPNVHGAADLKSSLAIATYTLGKGKAHWYPVGFTPPVAFGVRDSAIVARDVARETGLVSGPDTTYRCSPNTAAPAPVSAGSPAMQQGAQPPAQGRVVAVQPAGSVAVVPTGRIIARGCVYIYVFAIVDVHSVAVRSDSACATLSVTENSTVGLVRYEYTMLMVRENAVWSQRLENAKAPCKVSG